MSRIVPIQAAKHGELGEAVLQRIEKMVLTGAIGAGERINELQLAARLKVSRGPLREALGRLEASGLLVSIPNRGMFVRKVELADALHLYDVRAGLARTTGRLAAQRTSPPQVERLRAAFGEMEAAVKADDVGAFYAGNLDFHSLLIQYAGNPRLATMNEAVRNELQLYLRDAVVGPARLAKSQAEHRAILTAIAAGDADRAGTAFEAHILAGKQRMLDYLGGRGVGVAPLRLAP